MFLLPTEAKRKKRNKGKIMPALFFPFSIGKSCARGSCLQTDMDCSSRRSSQERSGAPRPTSSKTGVLLPGRRGWQGQRSSDARLDRATSKGPRFAETKHTVEQAQQDVLPARVGLGRPSRDHLPRYTCSALPARVARAPATRSSLAPLLTPPPSQLSVKGRPSSVPNSTAGARRASHPSWTPGFTPTRSFEMTSGTSLLPRLRGVDPTARP